MGILEVFMNRRAFLAAAGGSLTALRSHAFEHVAGAAQSRAERGSWEMARDEGYHEYESVWMMVSVGDRIS